MPSILLAADSPLGHVLDHGHVWSEMQWVGEFGLTIHAVMLVISAVTLLAAMALAASRIATGPESMGNERFVTKGRIAQVVEVLVIGLRDQMIEPILGEKQTRRWLPFLLSMFFFILVINLYGLVPLQDLQEELRRSGFGGDERIGVFTIGYGRSGEYDPTALRKIAESNGGEFVEGTPESILRRMEDLQLAF